MRVKRFIIDVLLLFTKKSVCMYDRGKKIAFVKALFWAQNWLVKSDGSFLKFLPPSFFL